MSSQQGTTTENNQMDIHLHGSMGEAQGTNVHQNVTKQLIMKYRRTLRHYVQLPSDIDNKSKQGFV